MLLVGKVVHWNFCKHFKFSIDKTFGNLWLYVLTILKLVNNDFVDLFKAKKKFSNWRFSSKRVVVVYSRSFTNLCVVTSNWENEKKIQIHWFMQNPLGLIVCELKWICCSHPRTRKTISTTETAQTHTRTMNNWNIRSTMQRSLSACLRLRFVSTSVASTFNRHTKHFLL